MNQLIKIAVLFSTCLLVSACAGKGPVVEDESAAALAVLPTSADYEVPEVADYNFDITLRNNAIDDKLMLRETLPNVMFTVWGFDELAADVSATEIFTSEFPLRPQSVFYPLRFNASDFQLIEFQSGRPEALKYYVTFGIDVDEDRKVCNGDFRQDYSVSRPERFPATNSNVSRSYEVIEVIGEICAR